MHYAQGGERLVEIADGFLVGLKANVLGAVVGELVQNPWLTGLLMIGVLGR